MLHAGQRESSVFGLVDSIPPSIACIFFLNLAGWHSLDKLRPAEALGRRMSAQLDLLATDGRCSFVVASLGLH